ncbi:MAG: NAD(+)/NADH kinase [Sandaracinaceae bacterium]
MRKGDSTRVPSGQTPRPTGPPSHYPPKKRVLFVHKKSAYQLYVRERNNPRIRKLIEDNDRTVRHLIDADHAHLATIEEARQACKDLGIRGVFRYRSEDGMTLDFDLIVTIGGDGTLLWVSHRVGAEVPVLAINSAPTYSVGHFCGARKGRVKESIAAALDGKLRATRLARMQVERDDEVLHRRVLNDALFCHKVPAATTRYLIEVDGREEAHKSSGVWVGPAAGSTAAIRSAGGKVLPAGSRRLQFLVREPYVEPTGPYRFTRGLIAPGESLSVYSQVREGRLYLDGPRVMHEVDMGQRITFSESEEPLMLLAFPRGRAATSEGRSRSAAR